MIQRWFSENEGERGDLIKKWKSHDHRSEVHAAERNQSTRR